MSEVKEVKVGDRMRISVELLREFDNQPDKTSVVVKVADVRIENDGTKTLLVEKAE